MSRIVRRLTALALVFALLAALAGCSGVQVKPRGEIVGGVSVGGRS